MLYAQVNYVRGAVNIDSMDLGICLELRPYDARTMDHIDFAPVFLLTG